MGVLKTDDINPDGLKVTIDWAAMDVGTSFFLPCINTEKARKQLKSVAKMKDFTLEIKIRVEDEKLGLRVWRTM